MFNLNKHSKLMSVIMVIISYAILLTCYLLDVMNSFVFVGILMVLTLIPIIFIVIFRKDKSRVNDFLIMFFLIIFLAIFELPLTQYEGQTHTVIGYREPELLLPESGIHIMAVNIKAIYFLENEAIFKQDYREQGMKIYDLLKLTNKDYYESKWIWIKSLVGLYKEDFSIMKENVHHYIGWNSQVVNEFLLRDDMEGDSAGLALGLIAMVEKGELTNNINIAFTGTLEKDGSTKAVGTIEEKLLIAEESDLIYFILPEENISEAEAAKKKHSLNVTLFPVNHIDEAVEVINLLNEKVGSD